MNQAQGRGEPGAPRTVIEPSVEPSGEPPSCLPAVPASPAKGRSKDEAEQARQEACREIWSAYSAAYEARYQTLPIRNAKVNRNVNDLLKRLGGEAAAVAAFYVFLKYAKLYEHGQFVKYGTRLLPDGAPPPPLQRQPPPPPTDSV